MLNTMYCNFYRPFKKYKFREKLLHKKSTLIIRYNFINTKFKNHLSLNIGYIITPHCLGLYLYSHHPFQPPPWLAHNIFSQQENTAK